MPNAVLPSASVVTQSSHLLKTRQDEARRHGRVLKFVVPVASMSNSSGLRMKRAETAQGEVSYCRLQEHRGKVVGGQLHDRPTVSRSFLLSYICAVPRFCATSRRGPCFHFSCTHPFLKLCYCAYPGPSTIW